MQGGASMKKTLIIVFLFCAATMLIGLRTGFAFNNYGPDNCKTCHEGAATVHAQHGDPLPDCNLCHVSGPGTTPPSSACAVCHGTCPLIYVHDDNGATCLSCHASDCPCPDVPPEVVNYDIDNTCKLNKEELKTYNDTLKADQKQAKDDLKATQTEEKNTYKDIKSDYAE